MKSDETIGYYDRNHESYSRMTVSADLSEIHNRFLDALGNKRPRSDIRILDFGCGSGRDTEFFLSCGFDVSALDGSEEMVRHASELTGIRVRKMLFQEFEETDEYDGIWACASLLHLKKEDLPDVLSRIARALRKNGICYMSFKYGTFEGIRGGRYYTDLREEDAEKMLSVLPLRIESEWISEDQKTVSDGEKWLNVIVRKVEDE